jgi:predicted phosphodiesterase
MKTCKKCGVVCEESKFPVAVKTLRGKVVRRGVCHTCFKKSRTKAGKEIDFDIDIDLAAWNAITRSPLHETPELEAEADCERVLFIPDCHHPYVDEKKWGLMLRAAMKFKPKTIVVLGDFADFYPVSSHSKQADRRHCLKDELAAVHKALRQLEYLGAKNNIYICGNHEDRYDRYINDRAPELHHLVSLRDALGLQEWTWVPYKTHFNLGKLHITHDCGNAGGDAHKKAQATFEGNVIIGHTHRIGYTVVGNAEGKPHLGAMLGWLGSIEDVDYMHRIKTMRDWAHGFGIGYMMKDGTVHVIPVPIVNNSVIIEGKLVK